jgi:hypothetical protein
MAQDSATVLQPFRPPLYGRLIPPVFAFNGFPQPSKVYLFIKNMFAQEKRVVVVTGVSTGIGWATAKSLVDLGFYVFGSVRKEVDAKRLQFEFGDSFTPLVFDVTDKEAVSDAAKQAGTQ